VNPKSDLFISDVHLSARHPERRRALLSFFERHGARAARLFILGDLFSTWIGYKQLRDADAAEVAEALRRLTASGVETHFIAGNRDFYSLRQLAARTGMITHRDGFAVESFGQKVWLCHGHDLYRHDRRTQSAQSITHARPVEWFFTSVLPASLAKFLAVGYQNHSSRVVGHKTRREITIPDAALIEIFEAGHQCVVCGHTHRLEHLVCRRGGGQWDLYNLGSWEKTPHFLRHGADGWHFHLLNK
jgi:UDP-2,3-diacylglucosamine hydrolase